MFVVTVRFRLRPGTADAFGVSMRRQAANSLALEAGCRQFDICETADDPDEIFLYEVYDDRAAFDAHLASEHFLQFDAEVAEMVAEKSVRTFLRIYPV